MICFSSTQNFDILSSNALWETDCIALVDDNIEFLVYTFIDMLLLLVYWD